MEKIESQIQAQSGLHVEFEDNLGFEKKKKKAENTPMWAHMHNYILCHMEYLSANHVPYI
jgi:hypothetical protein